MNSTTRIVAAFLLFMLAPAGLGCKRYRQLMALGDAGAANSSPPAASPPVAASSVARESLPPRIRQLREQRSSPRCPPGTAFVPGATFMMGSAGNEPEDAKQWVDWEEDVSRTRPAQPVSVAEYRECVARGACDQVPTDMLNNSSSPGGKYCNWNRKDRDELSMDCVDQKEAARYCARDGRRLPTESEWEFAARGTDKRALAFGNPPPEKRPDTCASRRENDYVCRIASFPDARSPFGIYDMAFADSEWTGSKYCDYPKRDCDTKFVVVRGGISPTRALTTSRQPIEPSDRTSITFRCAGSVDSNDAKDRDAGGAP